MTKKWNLKLADRELSMNTQKYAKQANGAVFASYGDSNVLVTATMSEPREGINYFPLMVNYEERVYAIGKIPGSITRREGRPRDLATLSARLIDRPLRPLFPEGFRHDVQVIVTVLSVDDDCDPEILGMNAASAALCLSDIPFSGPIAGVKVGMIDDNFIINPGKEQRTESKLELTVAGTDDAILMVESSAREVKEKTIIDGIEIAHENIKEIVSFQNEMVAEAGKEKYEFIPESIPESLEEKVKSFASEKIEKAIRTEVKQKREQNIEKVKEETRKHFTENLSKEDKEEIEEKIGNIIDNIIKNKVRELIINEGIRPDGRTPEDIRDIWCEVDILSKTHGSGVFTRGQTQVMSVVTLGAFGDEKTLFGLGEEEKKRYMHHYNFPPYSVGETNPLRSPGRREIGHGFLGERALKPVIPDKNDFPYTIRVVSEVLESNGSSSQASICGSSLALMDAGVPIEKPVAGVAMGLIKEDDQVKILSDILGFEDHHGDMDFKVAGTKDGITALQMDIKIKGISKKILIKALEQAKKGRLHILNEMHKVIGEPRENLSAEAPYMITMQIDPEKIRHVIGPGGKMINKIIDETGVQIDIEDDGEVYILADNQESGEQAHKMVENLTRDVVVGELYDGEVKRIVDFGAFVEILPGKEGLVHISQIADYHVKEVGDELSVGDEIPVKVTEIDDKGRINLSRKKALKEKNSK